MGRQSSIQIGEKYGRWKVLEHTGKQLVSPKRTVFKCICDCGTIKLVDSGNLKKPGNKSCGCLRAENARITGKKQRTEKTYMNYFYNDYRRSAKNRDYIFDISREIFYKIVQTPCYYCNKLNYRKPRAHKDVGIPIKMNGIDRLNNNIGYIETNCVSCCTICNYMKQSLSFHDFLSHILKIISTQLEHREIALAVKEIMKKELPTISKACNWI